jgi:hypothetical protein
MQQLDDAFSRLLELASPWPAIFAFDLCRYLLAATLLSAIILLVPSRVAAFGRGRRSFPRPNQTSHELRHSVTSAATFAVVGLGVYHGARAWLASWWGQWFTTTLHHDMHHQHGRCNYGLYFAWWDRWCGTEHPDYRPQLAVLVRSLDPHEASSGVAGKDRRSHAGVSVTFCVVSLRSLVISGEAQGGELMTDWATQGNAAHVRIERREGSLESCLLFVCDTQVWRRADAVCKAMRFQANDPHRARPY